MPESGLLQTISQKESDKDKIADLVIEQPALLDEVFDGLNADTARKKYGSGTAEILPGEKRKSLPENLV